MTLLGIDWRSIFTKEKLMAIYDGCSEAIKIKLEKSTDLVVSVQAYRMEMVCKGCKLNNDGQCNPDDYDVAVIDFTLDGEQRFKGNSYKGCGCYLRCKTANMAESCPLGKWRPHVD